MVAAAVDEASGWFFLDDAERDVVGAALRATDEGNPPQALILRANLDIVAGAAELLRKSPPISKSWESGGRSFSGEALVDLLCRVPDYDLDLHIPTKAVLGQAYLIAKINFFKALRYSLEPMEGTSDLRDRLEDEMGQSIYSKLAEELFISIVTDAAGDHDVKGRAARFLFRIWEGRLDLEIDDFAPVLESAWQARNKVRPVLGTMLGTHEVFRLFQEARDDRFLGYFGSDEVQEEELLAFEEFLFGLSHEEILELRRYLDEHGAAVLTIEQARQLLGKAKRSWAPQINGPQALYTSYKKRRVKALYRTLTCAPGPKKTAEEYVMISTLLRQSPSSKVKLA